MEDVLSFNTHDRLSILSTKKLDLEGLKMTTIERETSSSLGQDHSERKKEFPVTLNLKA
jgi:hypothetical protein